MVQDVRFIGLMLLAWGLQPQAVLKMVQDIRFIRLCCGFLRIYSKAFVENVAVRLVLNKLRSSVRRKKTKLILFLLTSRTGFILI